MGNIYTVGPNEALVISGRRTLENLSMKYWNLPKSVDIKINKIINVCQVVVVVKLASEQLLEDGDGVGVWLQMCSGKKTC